MENKFIPITYKGVVYDNFIGSYQKKGETIYSLSGIKDGRSVNLGISEKMYENMVKSNKPDPKLNREVANVSYAMKANSIKYNFANNNIKYSFTFEDLQRYITPYLVNAISQNLTKFKTGVSFYFNIKAIFIKNDLVDFVKEWEDEAIMKYADKPIDEKLTELIHTYVQKKVIKYIEDNQLTKNSANYTEINLTCKTGNVINELSILDTILTKMANLKERFYTFDKETIYLNFAFFESVVLYCAKYIPLNAESYIDLPKWIKDKKAVINIKNKDNKCFLWSILAGLYPSKTTNPERVKQYEQYENKVNMQGIVYPVNIKQYKKIEEQNDFSFNVLSFEEKKIIPLYTTIKKKDKHINLLFINGEEEKNHYCYIKNISALLSSQVCKSKSKMYYCLKCLCEFRNEQRLKKHEDICLNDNNEIVKVEFPTIDYIEFKDDNKANKLPFVIYSDCEAILQKTEETKGNKTNIYQKHIAYSFGFKIVSIHNKFFDDNKQANNVFMYKGEQCVDNYLKDIKLWSKKIIEFMTTNGIEFDIKTFKIPVVFHNLKRYDSHFLLPKLSNYFKIISCIPKTTDEYITFSADNLKFIDSFAFLSTSLDALSSKLTKFDILKGVFNNIDDDKLKLITCKGVYPYDYFDSIEKFKESKLPSKEYFYNKLNDCKISDEDYEHAQKVFDTFECKNLEDYHDLYLKTDILLLADVCESFRNTCIKDYGLEPFYYITLPSFSWSACLKMTKVKLEIIKDIDMYLMIESGIRGGISIIMNRYSKANNKYMADYDEKKPSKYIWYVDANNLYGWSMNQPLPVDNIKWNNDEWNTEKVMEIKDDAEKGYILEVDLEYPKELHDKHRFYPLAPEKMAVENNMLSDYSKQLLETLDIKEVPIKKLIPNLYDKTKYVVHYRNLKLYLSLGLKLKNVHRVIEFRQTPFMKDYIDLNTNKRKVATSDFEKDLYKLMNNSVFGKTMENPRHRCGNVDLLGENDVKRFNKLLKNPLLKSWHHLSDDENSTVAVHRGKSSIMLDKPIICGFSILDLSKHLMYDFFYNTLKPIYKDKIKVNMTDTDSLLLEIETNDLYEDMNLFKDKLDLSEYPKNHKLYNDSNKKVIGKFKDESNGIPIIEFIGLRSKMYSFIDNTQHEKQTAKGVKKSYVKKNIKHEHFKNCLFGENKENMKQSATFNLIRTYKQEIKSITVSKNSLVCYDDKTYLINNLESLPHGHYLINNN